MKCVIPGINIKVFGRAIHSLAKIGEELYVEPSSKGVAFRTVNSSRSAFASYTFSSGFFSQYDDGSLNQEKDAGEETVKCKVAMKACLNVFKSLATLERTVERCKITLDGEEDKLGIQLNCRHGINKTYNLSFIECETLQAVFDRESCPNYIQSQSRVLSDAVLNFQLNQDEVTLCVSPEKIIIRNYVEDEPDPAKAIHTVLTLEAGEFDRYNITGEGEVTFCLKEFRAVLTFAEPVNLPVTCHFSNPGRSQNSTFDNMRSEQSTLRRSDQIGEVSSRLFEKRALQTSSQSSLENKPILPSSPLRLARASTTNGNTSHINMSMRDDSLPDLNGDEGEREEEDIPGTPPAKRAKKFIFQRCFESTFNPEDVPGHDRVLAEDSDEGF
ncbi:hypothetical protein C7M84_004896 [Penaeus vannamei]|uniref:Cell cycle checkpoint control protein RAD9A n=1 Tax=Penaeus vannamei TaxID=6689 RepID=A0A423TJ99_PENVA|nr:hypothetical protein C7M84_004896 [Penaeus vannamei]